MLKRIFRPTKDRDCVEKIKTNYELSNQTRNIIWLTTLRPKIELACPCTASDKW